MLSPPIGTPNQTLKILYCSTVSCTTRRRVWRPLALCRPQSVSVVFQPSRLRHATDYTTRERAHASRQSQFGNCHVRTRAAEQRRRPRHTAISCAVVPLFRIVRRAPACAHELASRFAVPRIIDNIVTVARTFREFLQTAFTCEPHRSDLRIEILPKFGTHKREYVAVA